MLVLATLVATVGTMSMAMVSAHAAPSKKKFCDVNWKVSTFLNSIPNNPTAAQTKKIESKIDALLDDAAAVVPPEIEPQVTAASAVLRQGLETAFQDPTLQENGQAIDVWAADNCGYQVVDVHATEYHFAGIPKKLDPGRTIFRLANDGKEIHEVAVVRIKTKTPLKKLLADEKRAHKETVDAGFTFATQGTTGYAYVDLKNGRHAAVCFVPVGSVDPNTRVDGPPHASQGMVQEFHVSS
jgi:hypothetical protein